MVSKPILQTDSAAPISPEKSNARRKKARSSLLNKLALALVFFAFFSGLTTYAVLSIFESTNHINPDKVYWLLNFNIALFALICCFVGFRIFTLWRKRQKALAGAALHKKLVQFFSLTAVIPAVLMAILSVTFFYFGMQAWFSQRVSTAVSESQAVAQAYLAEHQQVIKADALAMAADLNRDSIALISDPRLLQTVVQQQSFLRNLSEVIIFHSSGEILARTGLSFSLAFEEIPDEILEATRRDSISLMKSDRDDRLRALIHLRNFGDVFLFVGRMVDQKVLEHISLTEKAVQDYKLLEGKKLHFQLSVSLLYIFIAILVLMAASLFGLLFAKRFMDPIENMIGATDRIRAGDFSVRILEKEGKDDELSRLVKAFNKMTSQIENQRSELISANRALDDRRHFIETIFSNVSAGIIALDEKGIVTIANERAAFLLFKDIAKIRQKKISHVNDVIGSFFDEVLHENKTLVEKQLRLDVKGHQPRTLLTRIYVDRTKDGAISSSVITFDDISELIAAQSKAAWSGVAKRIAHEIKNPLTPILLSAERLKRKYMKQISNDQDTFEMCIDTIIRQVETIGRMVNEFSSFARMPEAMRSLQSIDILSKKAFTLQKQAYPKIHFEFNIDENADFKFSCDADLITQAMTNLLQNAVDSVLARIEDNKNMDYKPAITMNLYKEADELRIEILDTGLGLPKDSETKDRLMEPYITTKEKGSGLGLAIVKKIVEDHEGTLSVADRIDDEKIVGAKAVIRFSLINISEIA